MKVRRIDHLVNAVHDLAAAKAISADLGLEVQGQGELEGEWPGDIVGLKDVKTAFIFLQTPQGDPNIGLIQFQSPVDQDGRAVQISAVAESIDR